MQTVDWIGWAAALLLFATVSRQVWKQWQEDHCRGVSLWLFLGQLATAAGFLLYGWLLGSQVFLLSNLLLVASLAILIVLSRVRSSQMNSRKSSAIKRHGSHQRRTRLA